MKHTSLFCEPGKITVLHSSSGTTP